MKTRNYKKTIFKAIKVRINGLPIDCKSSFKEKQEKLKHLFSPIQVSTRRMKNSSGPRAKPNEATVNSKPKRKKMISKTQEEFGPAIRGCDLNKPATLTSSDGFVSCEPSEVGDRSERRRRRSFKGEMELGGMGMEDVETTKSLSSSIISGETLHSASAQSKFSTEGDTSFSADSATLQEKSNEEEMEEASSPAILEDGAALEMSSISTLHSENLMEERNMQEGIAPKSVNSVDPTTQEPSSAESSECQFQAAHQEMHSAIGLMESGGKFSSSEIVEFLGIQVGNAEERQESPSFADSALHHQATMPIVDQSPDLGEIRFPIAHPANVFAAMPSISSSGGKMVMEGDESCRPAVFGETPVAEDEEKKSESSSGVARSEEGAVCGGGADLELEAEIVLCEGGGTPLRTDEFNQDGGPGEDSEAESEDEHEILNENEYKHKLRFVRAAGLSEIEALQRLGPLPPPRLIPGSSFMSDMWDDTNDPELDPSEERLIKIPALNKCVLIRTAYGVLSGVRFPDGQTHPLVSTLDDPGAVYFEILCRILGLNFYGRNPRRSDRVALADILHKDRLRRDPPFGILPPLERGGPELSTRRGGRTFRRIEGTTLDLFPRASGLERVELSGNDPNEEGKGGEVWNMRWRDGEGNIREYQPRLKPTVPLRFENGVGLTQEDWDMFRMREVDLMVKGQSDGFGLLAIAEALDCRLDSYFDEDNHLQRHVGVPYWGRDPVDRARYEDDNRGIGTP